MPAGLKLGAKIQGCQNDSSYVELSKSLLSKANQKPSHILGFIYIHVKKNKEKNIFILMLVQFQHVFRLFSSS